MSIDKKVIDRFTQVLTKGQKLVSGKAIESANGTTVVFKFEFAAPDPEMKPQPENIEIRPIEEILQDNLRAILESPVVVDDHVLVRQARWFSSAQSRFVATDMRGNSREVEGFIQQDCMWFPIVVGKTGEREIGDMSLMHTVVRIADLRAVLPKILSDKVYTPDVNWAMVNRAPELLSILHKILNQIPLARIQKALGDGFKYFGVYSNGQTCVEVFAIDGLPKWDAELDGFNAGTADRRFLGNADVCVPNDIRRRFLFNLNTVYKAFFDAEC